MSVVVDKLSVAIDIVHMTEANVVKEDSDDSDDYDLTSVCCI